MFQEAFQCFQLLSHNTLHLTSLKADELSKTSLCEVIFHTQTQPHVFHGIPHPPFLYLHCMQPYIIQAQIYESQKHTTLPRLKLLAGSEFSKCTITPPLFDWSPVWLQDIFTFFHYSPVNTQTCHSDSTIHTSLSLMVCGRNCNRAWHLPIGV